MSRFFEDPTIYRLVLENLPIGIYVLDREQRVRFWNRGAEQITGYLAHEVMGKVCRESLPHCDPQGRVLAGEHCSVTTTFRDGRAVQNHVFTLHKQGHRLGVQIRTLPLVDDNGLTMGVAVAFEEAPAPSIPEMPGALMCGCLDPLTGVSSQRLTRAVLTESLAELEDTHGGWGLLRIRTLGLKELSARYGTDSIAAFLRTSAQTIRHSLRAEDFLGRWGDDEFLVMLHTASPINVAAIAELISQQISQSEISWWGDRFRVRAVVAWTIAGLDSGDFARPDEARAHPGGLIRNRCGRRNWPRSFARIEFSMFAIIGIVVVFGCIVAGYLMEHGNLKVLMQPAELIIIGGAAAGTVLIANPLNTLKDIARGVARVFGSSHYTSKTYVDLLTMTFQLLNKARREGLVALESDVEDPQKSPLISKYAAFAKDHHAVNFLCDTMRMAISGGIEAFDLDQMLEGDLDIHHHEGSLAPAALNTMADALPGLGIVAAVLGVVITMGSLGGPPEEIGHKVAAALVGTFLGILLCYGLFGPIAQRMSKSADEERAFLNVMRAAMIAFLKGIAPVLAVEIGRRAVPVHVRPLFKEVEDACRAAKTGAAGTPDTAAAAAAAG